MINKKCHSAPRCETIVRYIFAATLKDAEKRKDIEYIGENITCGSPFGSINSQGIRNVDTRSIEAEFNAKMSLYTGTGTQLVSHHVLSLLSVQPDQHFGDCDDLEWFLLCYFYRLSSSVTQAVDVLD